MRAPKVIVDAVDDTIVSTVYERGGGGEGNGCHGTQAHIKRKKEGSGEDLVEMHTRDLAEAKKYEGTGHWSERTIEAYRHGWLIGKEDAEKTRRWMEKVADETLDSTGNKICNRFYSIFRFVEEKR